MAEYGLRLKDNLGNSFQMTPNAATIISAGRITLSNSLNGDGTYGSDINLPAANIPAADLGVIVTPVSSINSVVYARYIDGSTLYYNTFYANSASAYYTRNDATGVMTSWSAGARTANVKNTWNPVLSVYPIAFWDKLGASTFSQIRLFAATAYLVRQTTDDVNFSLAGTASGNYNYGGPESTINDNNEETAAGGDAWATQLDVAYQERTFGSTLQVTFATAKTIYKAEVCHYLSTSIYLAGSSYGTWSVSLFCNGAWNEILAGSWAYPDFVSNVTVFMAGYWSGVTAIKVYSYCYAKKGSGFSAARTVYACRELRAYGPTSTDDDENKIVYSIGNAGVAQVDYLIAMKKYNY